MVHIHDLFLTNFNCKFYRFEKPTSLAKSLTKKSLEESFWENKCDRHQIVRYPHQNDPVPPFVTLQLPQAAFNSGNIYCKPTVINLAPPALLLPSPHIMEKKSTWLVFTDCLHTQRTWLESTWKEKENIQNIHCIVNITAAGSTSCYSIQHTFHFDLLTTRWPI